jgi:hypothetical protein
LEKLEKIDAENKEFYDQSYEKVTSGAYSIKDILGFDLKKPAVFIPRVPCAHVAPSIVSSCEPAREKSATSILTLLPLYNTLIYPIAPRFKDAKMSEATFRAANDISLEDFLKIVETGRIVPYFVSRYKNYDLSFLQHFLEPGLPRISQLHMDLVRSQNNCNLVNGDCSKCQASGETAKKDISAFMEEGEKPKSHGSCHVCLSIMYNIGINREDILKTTSPLRTICATIDVLASRNLEAAFQTNCPIVRESLGLFAGAPEIADPIEAVVEGLKVKYTSDLDLESYLHLIDEKTTRAVREVITKIMEDPFASKYSERLNSKVFEFNREVEEVGKSKTAKFYHAVSDIAVYGGAEFTKRQARGYFHPKKKDIHRVSEWIASKLMDIHAKATGKDWTIAQLYRTRWKIEQCKKQSHE